MSRYFLGAGVGFLVLLAIWCGLFAAAIGLYDKFGDRTIAAWYQIKREAVDAAAGKPKIVLAGGSNVLYGLRAAEIGRMLGVPCVNYGVHAALPLDYLLSSWKQALDCGDLLVLSLEWQFLRRRPDEINEVFAGYLLGGDPRYFLKLPLAAQAALVFGASPRRLLLPLFVSRRENAEMQNVCYEWNAAYYVDRHGDYLRNPPERGDANNVRKLLGLRVGQVVAPPGKKDDPNEEAAWQKIGEFAEWAAKKGVRIVYAAPALLSRPEFSAAKYRKRFAAAEAHYAALGILVVSPQRRNLYPPELMFDSVYHLNSEGAALRSRQLAEALRPLLAKP